MYIFCDTVISNFTILIFIIFYKIKDILMNIINSIITNTNNIMYGYLLLAVFFVVAVFFTIRLKGIQISHSIHALKLLFSKHEV